MTHTAPATNADRLRALARGLGQALITAGVVLLLFVVYDLWFTNLYTNHEQGVLRHQLQQQWAAPPPVVHHHGVQLVAVPLGSGIAILRIPRLGRGWVKVVVEGVGHDDLEKGPGHYPGTALPGQVGNFVVSGHRTTWGAPFNRLDVLRRGDVIVVETRTTWYTYDVAWVEIVDPTDLGVIAPVPDHPGQVPTRAYLTFTTCNPKFSAAQRLVVHGLLVATTRKPATPAALGG